MANTFPTRSYPGRAWPTLAWPLYGSFVPPVTINPGVPYGDWRREGFEQLLTAPARMFTVNTRFPGVGGLRTGPDEQGKVRTKP
jgi:hypothetical protein